MTNQGGSAERCPECGKPSLARDRVRVSRSFSVIEAVACTECGEWWFEANGRVMTTDTIIDLGLAT